MFAFWQAFGLIKNFQADFVFSVGGYSAAPAAFATLFLRIPLIIHEQNAKIGRLNQILKPFAKLFFSSYLESSPIRFYPVSERFFECARVRKEIKNILFMGGSQGAKSLNDFALTVAQDLKNAHLKVFHQCGLGNLKHVCLEYLEQGLNVGILGSEEEFGEIVAEISIKNAESLQRIAENWDSKGLVKFDVILFGFSKEMFKILNLCDFAVCRAGASSLWELCANGLPALFVPYPYAAGNHQYYNAHFIEQKGLGFLCLEQNLFCDVLWDCLELARERIAQISQNLQQECAKDATTQMCDVILAHYKSKRA